MYKEQEFQPKKILFVITKSNWGGAQKYVFDLATSLDKSKWTASVALGGEGDLKNRLEESGIKTIKLTGLKRDVSLFKEWYVLFYLWKIFRRERPDIIHLNSSKIGGIGSLAGRLAGIKKIIFTAHGWAFNEERKISSLILIKIAHWLTILFSHKVIVLSEREKSQVEKWPFTKKKLKVIPNGIQQIDFEPRNIARLSIASFWPALNSHMNKKWIGNIAELHSNKGLKYAIEAMKNIEDAIYIIIGDGELFDEFKKYIKTNELENKVFLLGKIKDASKYLKGFDMILFPSIKEGLPYFILEAGLSGRAIIASNVGGIPEIITQQESGLLVHPRQSKDIKIAIKHLIESPDEIERLGNNLQEKIEKDFLFKKMFENTREEYNK